MCLVIKPSALYVCYNYRYILPVFQKVVYVYIPIVVRFLQPLLGNS